MNNNLTNSNFNDNLTSTSSAKFNIINTNNTNFIELNSSNNEFIIDPNSTGIHLGSIIINSKNNSFINRLIDQVSVNHNKKMTSIINNEDVNNNLTNFYIDIASNEANNSKTDFNQTEIVSQSSTSILNSSSTISPSTTSPSSIITLLKNSFNLSSNNQLTTESLPKLSMTKTIPLTELQQTISSNSTQIPLISQITMPSQISTTNFTNMTTSTLTTTSSIYNINPSEYDDDYISSCFSSPEDYDLFTATICATFFVFGILYTIYGYRCFKSVLFFTGFLFATIVIYFICLSESLMPIYGNIGVSLIAGFLFGLITLLVAYVGLFMLGFHLGLLIAMASLIVIYLTAPFVDWLLVPSSGWILFAIFMTLGLTGACGTLYFQRGKTNQ